MNRIAIAAGFSLALHGGMAMMEVPVLDVVRPTQPVVFEARLETRNEPAENQSSSSALHASTAAQVLPGLPPAQKPRPSIPVSSAPLVPAPHVQSDETTPESSEHETPLQAPVLAVASVAPAKPGPSETSSPRTYTSEFVPPEFAAEYLKNPKPAYPALARRMHLQGTVLLRVWVGESGKVREVSVHQSSGFDALDTAALNAVQGWRFAPARRGDMPVDAWVEVPVKFSLAGG